MYLYFLLATLTMLWLKIHGQKWSRYSNESVHLQFIQKFLVVQNQEKHPLEIFVRGLLKALPKHYCLKLYITPSVRFKDGDLRVFIVCTYMYIVLGIG